jgi:hypothetical protein
LSVFEAEVFTTLVKLTDTVGELVDSISSVSTILIPLAMVPYSLLSSKADAVAETPEPPGAEMITVGGSVYPLPPL